MESILKIAAQHRLHKEKEKALNEAGYETETAFMGSGGIGQYKYFPRLGYGRLQVGCGYGRNNRALCVVIRGIIR